MGLLQTSAADGMGGARMDIGISAHQLVVSVDGVGQCRIRVVDRRSDFASLRQGRQESDRAAALDAAADLSVSHFHWLIDSCAACCAGVLPLHSGKAVAPSLI